MFALTNSKTDRTCVVITHKWLLLQTYLLCLSISSLFNVDEEGQRRII